MYGSRDEMQLEPLLVGLSIGRAEQWDSERQISRVNNSLTLTVFQLYVYNLILLISRFTCVRYHKFYSLIYTSP